MAKALLIENGPVQVHFMCGIDPTVRAFADQLHRIVRDELEALGAFLDIRLGERFERFEDLGDRLARREQTILVLVGHADKGGAMTVQDAWGAMGLTPTAMAAALRDSEVRIVVAMTCWGAAMAETLTKAGVVDVAIGLSEPLALGGALGYTRGFLRGLARGRSIAEAHLSGQSKAAGRLGETADQIALLPAEGEVLAKAIFEPPVFCLIGRVPDAHRREVEKLVKHLSPHRAVYVDNAGIADDVFQRILANIGMARVIMVLFEGDRVRDADILEQVTRSIDRARDGSARVFPLYLEGTESTSQVPYGLRRIRPAFLEDRRYGGKVERLAEDLKRLV